MTKDQLDASTSKLLESFHTSFEHTAETGMLDGTLHTLLNLLAGCMPADVQEVEGLNGMIKKQVQRCPRIGLGLLSSRISVAKHLALNTQSTFKWSDIQDNFNFLAREAEASFQEGVRLMEDETRFSPVHPYPEHRSKCQGTGVKYSSYPSAVLVCALRWNLQYYKGLGSKKKRTVLASTVCFFIATEASKAPKEAWLCASTRYSRGLLLCLAIEDQGDDVWVASIPDQKLELCDSVCVFADHYDQAQHLSQSKQDLSLYTCALSWRCHEGQFVADLDWPQLSFPLSLRRPKRKPSSGPSTLPAATLSSLTADELADVDVEGLTEQEYEEYEVLMLARLGEDPPDSGDEPDEDYDPDSVDLDETHAEKEEEHVPAHAATHDAEDPMVIKVLSDWARSFAQTCRCLEQRAQLFRSVPDPLKSDTSEGNLAVLQCSGDGVERVCFVHWTDFSTRRGRYVALDRANRVIYSSPAFEPVQDFSSAIIVHPNTGVRMLKQKGLLRADMDKNMLHLKAVWEAFLIAGSEGCYQMAFCTCAFCSQEISGSGDRC
eukprot:1784743-Amphidinium_carterae.1